jgi:hypothetical protein
MHDERLPGLVSDRRPRWTLRNVSLLLSACFLVYVVLAAIILGVLSAGYSPGVFVELIGAGLFLLSQPLFPLLEHLDLMEGEYWRGPSLGGLLVVVVIYLILLNLPNLLVMLWRRLNGGRRSAPSA